jgi:hypothetical protein
MINELYNHINHIEYEENSNFKIPRSIKNENLVELNINAFKETYEINKEQKKELIGNLNWRKFSERI